VVKITSKLTTKLSGFFTIKKGGLISLNSFNCSGMVLDGTLFSNTTPFLEFSIKFQSNNPIYDKGYSKRQQVIYCLVQLLREEEMGYWKMNDWGIKTHRGHKWFNTSVYSVLKRKHERDLMNGPIRNQHFPTKISKLEVYFYIFDKKLTQKSNLP